ncbi:uncharacterized protein [Argopecten irradians]|uniref:uncharacterized protein n=1 Tax=Argopecten irradians TaxID=31199 RepID=UPI00371F5BB1
MYQKNNNHLLPRNCVYWLLLALLVVTDARTIRSERSTSDIPHGLNSPCGPSNRDAPLATIIEPLQRDHILNAVEDVQRTTNQLQELYVRSNKCLRMTSIGTTLSAEIYLEEVIGLPGPEEIAVNQDVTVDYIVVSHLLVFVDIVISDNGAPRDTVHRHALWQELRLQVLSLLCDMRKAIVDVPQIASDITPPCVVEASCNGQRSRFTRNMRNHVIVSTVRDVSSRLHQKYSQLPVQ